MGFNIIGKELMLKNKEIKFSRGDYEIIRQAVLQRNTEMPDISERKALLDWLEYNDNMYFEKTAAPEAQAGEEFWFQKYIGMPLDELKKTVYSKKSGFRK